MSVGDRVWFQRCERALRDAGAVPADAPSGSTHRKWYFPGGAFMQFPLMSGAHKSVHHYRNAESKLRSMIRRYGTRAAAPTKAPGMRPSDVDTWVPHVHPTPKEDPLPMAIPKDVQTYTDTTLALDATLTPLNWICPVCEHEFPNPKSLAMHRVSAHQTAQPCPVCGKEFKNVGRHATSHKGVAKVEPTAPVPAAPKVGTKPPKLGLRPIGLSGSDVLDDLVVAVQGLGALVLKLRALFVQQQESLKLAQRDGQRSTELLARVQNALNLPKKGV